MARHGLLAVIIALALPAIADAQAAKDTLSYELTKVSIGMLDGRPHLFVVFAKALPQRYLAAEKVRIPTGSEWRIESRSLESPSTVRVIVAKSVYVPDGPAIRHMIAIEPETPLDPANEEIRVQLLEANFPEVTLGRPKKQAAAARYGPAKGKDDADIYFKGLAVATSRANPAYSIDAKFAYLQPLRSRFGSIGGGATYNVDKASDIGPDSITLTSSYANVFVLAPATGFVLNVDPLGFEFDAGNDVRNLKSAARGQFVIPSKRVGAKSFLTADANVGYEGGWTRKGGQSSETTGIWRTVIGANTYTLLQGSGAVKRVDIIAAWTVRLLAQDEPFTHLVGGVSTTERTDKPRHLFTVTGAFMISKALGFSVGYRHGSEPPTYKYVKHRGEVGIVLKLKQTDKG